MSRHGNQASMHQKIKDFAYEKKASSGGCIKDKNGEILFETHDIMKRWREYVEELFKDERNEPHIQTFLQGPTILRSEVEKALGTMKKGKACGIDNISTEMLQALGDFDLDTLTMICNKMYKSAYIPEDLRTSVLSRK